MSARRVVVHPDADVLAQATASRLLTRLLDLQSVHTPVHVVLTGGTVGIKVLADIAAHPVREAVDGELRYEVLDEVLAGRAHLTLTGSIRNVSPVVALDERDVTAGPLSLAAAELFQARALDDLDP